MFKSSVEKLAAIFHSIYGEPSIAVAGTHTDYALLRFDPYFNIETE
jgi:hypothetical protein